MRKIDVRVIRTYDQLSKSLISLLTKKSFDDLSVSEICDSAQVHRATFYKHFNDKFEFLNFCFNNELSKIDFDVSDNAKKAETLKENFMNFIKVMFEFVNSKKAIFEAILSNKFSATLSASFTSAVHNYCIEKISVILPEAHPERIKLFAAFYSNAFVGVLTQYTKNPDDFTLEEIYDFLENRVDELCSTFISQYTSKDQ
jgi:AcrR family transcriptional regulator